MQYITNNLMCNENCILMYVKEKHKQTFVRSKAKYYGSEYVSQLNIKTVGDESLICRMHEYKW